MKVMHAEERTDFCHQYAAEIMKSPFLIVKLLMPVFNLSHDIG